jgi:hypothetical protein
MGRYVTGVVLQVAGMAGVLVGLVMGLSFGNVRAELLYLGAGILLFYTGHVLRGGARK